MFRLGEYIIKKENIKESSQKAYFAAGCFWGGKFISVIKWCFIYKCRLQNGNTENPNYISVCYENTGHAEAVELIYNPKLLAAENYVNILKIHDPTTLNQQVLIMGHNIDQQFFILQKSNAKLQKK